MGGGGRRRMNTWVGGREWGVARATSTSPKFDLFYLFEVTQLFVFW